MREYIIKKGNHYSNHGFRPYLGISDKFEISALFDDSCRYNFSNPTNQSDINKLWGISFGYHQKNSIRIGWNYNTYGDYIDLWYYIYENSARKYGKFSQCNINDWANLTLRLNDFDFIMKDETLGNSRKVNYDYPDFRIGYYLYPYFGGNNPALHDVKIKLDYI